MIVRVWKTDLTVESLLPGISTVRMQDPTMEAEFGRFHLVVVDDDQAKQMGLRPGWVYDLQTGVFSKTAAIDAEDTQDAQEPVRRAAARGELAVLRAAAQGSGTFGSVAERDATIRATARAILHLLLVEERKLRQGNS